MRLLFPLALALAACSSDPAPIDSGPHVDQQPDSGWPWADAGLDAGARCTPGTQGTCACLPGPMRAVYVCPASGVPPEPCPCGEDLDGSARDVQGADQGVDVTTKDWPFEDRPDALVADAVVADARADGSAGVDVIPGVSSCAREADCGPRFHCFVPSGLCFECTADDHCAAGSICSSRNVCVAGCNAAHGCGGGRTCCDSVCRDLQSDSLACGTCNTRCTGGTTCGGGHCGAADAGADASRD